MSEFPIRAQDILIVFSTEPTVHYKVGTVEEDGQFRFTVASRVWIRNTEADAVESARDLARATRKIFLKNAKTGEWREIRVSGA